MHRISRTLTPMAAVIAAAGLLGACGGSSGNGSASGGGNSVKGVGNGTDLAFVGEMVPHHKSAIEMANIAKTRTKRPEIRTLAGNIVSTQRTEIGELETLRAKLVSGGVKPGSLGLDSKHMGMSMDTGMLTTANPFDRAFIDMMTPHHEGAIAMSKAELAKGASPEAKKIAQGIISAQEREIREMSTWRKSWYGAATRMHSMSG